MSMEGKVVLITGAAGGIGKAAAKKFVSVGATVVFCDIVEEAGKATAEEIGAIFYKVDVTDRKAVQAWVDDVVAKFGRIDVLVNNAGITRDARFVSVKDGVLVKQMDEAAFDMVVAINLKGTFNCAQAVAPVMINQKSGSIINVSSVVGLYGNFGQANYVATKAGVIGLTKVWARELGRSGIRVNAVAPGFIMTEMTGKMPPEILDGMKAKCPFGRLGSPEEVADVFHWLASDESTYVHGATISVDGGLVLGT
jgi:3-oxoacyl-[acyl-carrier protein] reductase